MNNWIFCINAYQEEEMLPGCLESIRLYCPDAHIVVVDGAYKPFIDNAKIAAAECYNQGNDADAEKLLTFIKPHSTDKTLEIAKKYDCQIIECLTDNRGLSIPWPTEHEKRSSYFVGYPGAWYFIIDADERLEGTPPNPSELSKSDHWCVMLKRDDKIPPYSVMRVHKHYGHMEYVGAHHALHVDGRIIRKDDIENFILMTCYLDHRWQERARKNEARHLAKGSYYRWLQVYENNFRKLNGC